MSHNFVPPRIAMASRPGIRWGRIAPAGAASINRPTVAVASRTAVGYATTVLGVRIDESYRDGGADLISLVKTGRVVRFDGGRGGLWPAPYRVAP